MSRRLLVLDDDLNVIKLLRTYFRGLGWHVEASAEADEAFALVDSVAPFDAVICDLHFTPAHLGEGYEIVARARQRRPTCAVVVFTGAAGAGVRDEAIRRGADEVIAKPAPLGLLRDAALRGAKKR